MANNEELLTTIDAKLSALLKLAVESESRPAGAPRAAVPTELAAPPGENGAGSPPEPPRQFEPEQQQRPSTPPRDDRLAEKLDEVARLLALSLTRKRDLPDVVADLDAVGFDRDRISELLGASPSRVDAALVAYDRRPRKKRR